MAKKTLVEVLEALGIIFSDAKIGKFIILFVFIFNIQFAFKINHKIRVACFYWGFFVLIVIFTRALVYVFLFFRCLYLGKLILGVYTLFKITVYLMSIFLIWGCIRFFPKAFRIFIERKHRKLNFIEFNLLISSFLLVLSLIITYSPVLAIWISGI